MRFIDTGDGGKGPRLGDHDFKASTWVSSSAAPCGSSLPQTPPPVLYAGQRPACGLSGLMRALLGATAKLLVAARSWGKQRPGHRLAAP